MYLPRNLISHLYLNLLKTHHPLSPPVLLLVALEPDALCACRILTTLLKRDYIPHKIQPISGYGDLSRAGTELVQPMGLSNGGSGGVAVCVGVGGLVDLESVLGLDTNEAGEGGYDGVEIWVFDSRRPWNLENVFGGRYSPQLVPDGATTGELVKKDEVEQGQILREYKPGKGGIIVFDDGDIEVELGGEREAYCALEQMPELDEDDYLDGSQSEGDEKSSQKDGTPQKKRKSWSDGDDEDSEGEKENRPHQRRRSNSSSPIPSFQAIPSHRAPPSPAKPQKFDPRSTPPSNQQSSPVRAQEPKDPSPRTLRRRLLRLRRKHDSTLRSYYSLGTSYSEPISSLMYSLASELGRDDNDLLWLAIIGVSSNELYGRTPTGISLSNPDVSPSTFTGWTGSRGSRIRQTLRDEVRRLNAPELTDTGREVIRGQSTDVIPTHARSPTDTSIRLSPEPRFLLIRHWSLYDSMLHSPYLFAKLHIWSDAGRRRLHKLFAKMGVSLTQCKQSYTHMDMDLKKSLRDKLLHFAPMYGLDGLVPPPSTGQGGDKEGWGFVRSWGWKACLSAADVAVVVGAMLEVGVPLSSSSSSATITQSATLDHVEDATARFYAAYDALLSPTQLSRNITIAQSLHRSILRTGTSLLQKRQIRHLRAFRLALVKEGPDVALFCHAGALTKLALWVAEAVGEVEKDGGEYKSRKKGSTPLVVGCLDDTRGVYVIVGTGGGGKEPAAADAAARNEKQQRQEKKKKAREDKEMAREARRREREENGNEEDESEEEEDSSESDEDDDSENEATTARRGYGRNRFGNAFQEVVEETSARVRIDSFEHSVVEVKKEDLSGFLESLSMKAVVG